MQAYNTTDLYNKYVQQQASEAFRSGCISAETYKHILEQHPSGLYTPNYFIRMASGLLTTVIIIFSGLLLGLMFQTPDRKSAAMLLFFIALINYSALELLVKSRQFYNAGVDNVLTFSTSVFIISAFAVYGYDDSFLLLNGIAMPVCLWLCLRFTDAFMAVLGYLALFIFVFLLYLKLGSFAKATAPFLMMMVSALVFIAVSNQTGKQKLLFYQFCCKTILVLTLLTFYASGNYFAVKEISKEMFHLHLSLKDTIPLGWLFWVLTIAIPPAYVLYGISKKNFMFIRVGLVLVFISILTVRYYYHVAPAETVMLVAGTLLISAGYFLMKYLKTPKYGFNVENDSRVHKNVLNAEALIIAQLSGKNHPGSYVQSGGGSFGGGGAGSNY